MIRRLTYINEIFLKTLIFKILYFLQICPIFDGSVDNFGQKGNFLFVKDLANEKGNTVFKLEFEPPVSSRCDSKLRLSGRKAASSLFHGQSRADKTDQYFLGVKQPQSLLVYLSWSTAEKTDQ